MARRLGSALGVRVSLALDSSRSGPARGSPDPLSAGAADLAWMCAPSYLWLSDRCPPAELVPAGLVFRDPRLRGRPLYYSEVIVRRGFIARSFADLRGCRWAYNDTSSLSGYQNLLKRLAESGEAAGFLGELRPSGSHLNSIRLVLSRTVDAALIDSNVLELALESWAEAREGLRVLESWGPFPVQPLVARAGLPDSLREELAAALLELVQEPEAREALARFHLSGFAPVTRDFYKDSRLAAGDWRRGGPCDAVRA